ADCGTSLSLLPEIGHFTGDVGRQSCGKPAFRRALGPESSSPRASLVAELPAANHYIFISNETDVQRELRRFLGDLRLHQRRVVTLARANHQVFPAVHPHADRMIEPVRLE